MSKDAKEIKITDKRMFTADGELREEYRFLAEKSTAPTPTDPADPAAAASTLAGTPAGPSVDAPAAAAAPAAEERADRVPAASSGREAPPPSSGRSSGGSGRSAGAAGAAGRDEPYPEEPFGGGDAGARLEIPGSPPGLGPSFYDLAAMLAEPVAVYLGDVELPDGQSAENLEMARLYIDLLDILRQKTAGNLTAQESAFLEDLLYRLRVRYVQKRG
ncbi:MAG TPA: DUF1844 domain-containing protein [Thermoanaerobaculia bacterium]|nr:DUF1844 domain-containing protein [Thermoanaerobaculia bacterium]